MDPRSFLVALATTTLAACPSDPEFALSEVATGTETSDEDTSTSTNEDTSTSTNEDTSTDTVAAPTCEPECPAGSECVAQDQCASCAYECGEVLVDGVQCGVDSCGGRCGCSDTGACDEGTCECPPQGCIIDITHNRARTQHILDFDFRGQPMIVTRGGANHVQVSWWNGATWDLDTPIANWGPDLPAAATVRADEVYVVHPDDNQETKPDAVVYTRWQKGREAVTTPLTEPSACERPRLVRRVAQGDILLGCIVRDTYSLAFYRLVASEVFTPTFTSLEVGAFDNEAAEPVVHDVSWTVDNAGNPVVLAPRVGIASPGELVLATWANDRWLVDVVSTIAPPPGARVETALVLAGSGPRVFFTAAGGDAKYDLRVAQQVESGWDERLVTTLTVGDTIQVLDAVLGSNNFVHLVRLVGETMTYDRMSGVASSATLPRTLSGITGLSLAAAPDGTAYIAWTAVAGLRFERPDVMPE